MLGYLMKKKDYEFLKIIGQGSFAKVYLAQDSQKQLFAIKVITIDINQTSECVKMTNYFEQEIGIYKKTQNDNIVQLIEEFREDDKIYCVFEYCSNGDLNNFLKSYTLDENQIKSIFIEILNGMAYLHKEGIVHRDLKIDNILIDENHVVKIADFGFAKFYNQGDILQSYCGTPATMAPEVLNQEEYNHKCDIWSLGVILYYMVYQRYHWSNKVKSLHDLTKELKNFQVTFHDNKFLLSDSGKDLISKMLDPNQNTRIDFKELFSHSWLEGAFDNRNSLMLSQRIIRTKLMGGQIGKYLVQYKEKKQQFLEIIKNLIQNCNNQDVSQLFTTLHNEIDKQHHIILQCQSIIHQKPSQNTDYKFLLYKTLQQVYNIIKFTELHLFKNELELMNLLHSNSLSNTIIITLEGQYTQEDLDQTKQYIQEINVKENYQNFKIETYEIDPEFKLNIENAFKAREIYFQGKQIYEKLTYYQQMKDFGQQKKVECEY